MSSSPEGLLGIDTAKQGREQVSHGLGAGKDMGLGEHRV